MKVEIWSRAKSASDLDVNEIRMRSEANLNVGRANKGADWNRSKC